MNFNRNFTILGKTFHISIRSEISNTKIYDMILSNMLIPNKLKSVNIMRENFHISLTDVKKILDNIVKYKFDANGRCYAEYLKDRDEIKYYIMSTLGSYERKIKKTSK